MKLFTGWVISAGLVFTATAAHAQMPAPIEIGRSALPAPTAVSDVSGPYAEMPPEAPPAPRYYGSGYGPTLLPPTEVYTVLRGEAGFRRLEFRSSVGLFYRIAVVDRRGDDGRLVNRRPHRGRSSVSCRLTG